MGSHSGGSQGTKIPKQFRPLASQTGDILQQEQQAIVPQFESFIQPSPQYIPPLTPGQENIAQLQYDRATAPSVLTSPEQQALSQIDYLTGGPLGQSPATIAAMKAARDPVLNDLALAGLGNSGSVESELLGAYAPILAQEVAGRQAVIPQLANIGQTEAQRRSDLLGQAFAGQEAGRQIDVQRGLADLNDLLRRQGLFQNLTTGLISPFGTQRSYGSSSQTGVLK